MHQYADENRYQMKSGYVSRLMEFDPNLVCHSFFILSSLQKCRLNGLIVFSTLKYSVYSMCEYNECHLRTCDEHRLYHSY